MADIASSEEEYSSTEEQEQYQEIQDHASEPVSKKQKLSCASSAPLQVAPRLPGKNKPKVTPRIIVLLDLATLETVKNRTGVYELLNCDDHRDLCKKKLRKDPNDYRPDILHQELLALMDSPLNKAGLLQIYIHTQKHVLIEVNPATRIPRTYKRFAGLMVQLLHKMKIKAGTESTTLLKVIKNPFSQHLPAGTRCFGFSCQGELYSPIQLAKTLLPPSPQSCTTPYCLVLGAMATGHVTINDHPYIEKMFSVSEYPLSGAAAISRIMGGIEHLWGIV
jgi:rRNA small subunit pseudouridine methyltransferase Nep1